ncbi:Eco57I restriction-modification methylase domain-containing protein [Thermosynechococcus sp. FA-CM-4201]
MHEMRLKKEIETSIQRFDTDNLADCTQNLFYTLGYRTDKSIRLEASTPSAFIEQFGQGKLICTEDWRFVDLVFQLTKDEITGNEHTKLDFGKQSRVDNTIIESYLFIAIELAGSQHSRTKLATIAREVNKLFAMPVMVLFKHGQTISLAIIDREINKRDESKDVLRKVTLIKDVSIASPYRAHIEILFDLSLGELHKKYKFTNFVELHRAWQNTLNITELNKRFFQEVSNWYFWARECVYFPDDAPKDEEGKDSASLIRLITRLIFIWFLKEKKGEDGQPLIPDELFRKDYLQNLIDLDNENTSTYYKAILQNLFFATLNQEMNSPTKPDNRRFRGKSQDNGLDHYSMIHNVYHYEDLFRNPAQALNLFESIPFLNGGLFECLDYLDPQTKKQVYIDGFSDSPDNKLTVPNYLFFSEERTVDLNQAYGTKNKRYKVRGLIDIFNRYKFTITENTPIEEEIALDPELLSKVFENLLALYNPETKLTARKQTGSFYTPREVVDYMVNQSLLLYLEDKIADNHGPQCREKLEQLLAYSYPNNPFADDPETTDLIISAIDNLKVLDPAVGSGAFPMGILQKLVFILGKLDPNNERWKQQQKEREILPLLNNLQQSKKISYEEARLAAIKQLQERLAQIEADFANNEVDYPRKLFLIENCIYGVDIQPIAVQIAKLRFFISLIVEQKVDDHAPNRGILPLPNLETKFVAANTLIGISDQLNLRSPEVIALEQELKEIRKKYFTARTLETKLEYRQRDEEIRREITCLLKEVALEPATADTVAKWNPYNQNSSATFFDPKWMFGVEKFDIIISNPPYGAKITKDEFKYIDKIYYLKTKETAILFLEKGKRLLNSHGLLAYIIPKSYSFASNYTKARELTLNELILTVDCGKVFQNVLLEVMIIILREACRYQTYTSISFKNLNFQVNSIVDKSLVTDFGFILNAITPIEINIAIKMKESNIYINDIATNSRGEPLQKFLSKNVEDYPVIGGNEINKYGVIGVKGYVKRNNIQSEKAFIRRNSVLVQNIVAHTTKPVDIIKIICCVLQDKDVSYVITDTINQIQVIDEDYSNYILWAILNSQIINWFTYYFIFGKAIRTMHFDSPVTARIPVPRIDCKSKGIIESIVNYILLLNEQLKKHTSQETESIRNFFEELLDLAVIELYLPEEMHMVNFYLLDYLASFILLSPSLNVELIYSVYRQIMCSLGTLLDASRLYETNEIVSYLLNIHRIKYRNGLLNFTC